MKPLFKKVILSREKQTDSFKLPTRGNSDKKLYDIYTLHSCSDDCDTDIKELTDRKSKIGVIGELIKIAEFDKLDLFITHQEKLLIVE